MVQRGALVVALSALLVTGAALAQPSPRSAASLAVHEPTGTVVMFGGGVGVAGGFEPLTERLVMTGGPDAPDAVDEVWTYDPRTEDWVGSERTPPADVVAYARMVYDTVTASLIRFGGHGEPAGTAWSVSADLEWTLLEPEGEGPRPISRHAMTAVPGMGVLIFGGVPRGSPDVSADLWLLDTRTMRWEPR